MNKKIILYGGGGHAKVVKECLEAQGDELIGFVDDNAKVKLFELPHLGAYSSDLDNQAHFVIAVGDNEHRRKIATRVTHAFTNAIHPTALISHSVKVGKGCMIFHRAIIQSSTKIGNHVILNTAAQVDHDCVIGDFVHVGPGAILCGDITIGEGVFIGAGAIILPGIKIGKGVTVGAGTVVTKDLPDHVVAYGNPASIKAVVNKA